MLKDITSRRTLLSLISSFGIYLFFNKNVTAGNSENIYSMEKVLSPRYLGYDTAPLKLVEYASLTCGHCADFHLEKLPEIKKRYIDKGLLRLEFRDFPLDGLALRASAIARLLEKDKYFKFIEVLFSTQKRWANSKTPIIELKKLGILAGLDSSLVNVAMYDMVLLENILNIRKVAENKWSIQSTPTFIVNNEIKIKGNQPLIKFEKAFEKFSS